MTTWEFKAEPPYIKNKGNLYQFIVSSLLVEDKNGIVDFKNDELWFNMKYEPSSATLGSVKKYISQKKSIKSTFVVDVQYNLHFTLIIKSYNDIDLSGLTAKFFSAK